MAYDIRWACDVLRPVFDRTDGKDGRVSIEVDPRIAHDTERTTAEAKALWWLVDRPERHDQDPGHRSRACRRSPRPPPRASASTSR